MAIPCEQSLTFRPRGETTGTLQSPVQVQPLGEVRVSAPGNPSGARYHYKKRKFIQKHRLQARYLLTEARIRLSYVPIRVRAALPPQEEYYKSCKKLIRDAFKATLVHVKRKSKSCKRRSIARFEAHCKKKDRQAYEERCRRDRHAREAERRTQNERHRKNCSSRIGELECILEPSLYRHQSHTRPIMRYVKKTRGWVLAGYEIKRMSTKMLGEYKELKDLYVLRTKLFKKETHPLEPPPLVISDGSRSAWTVEELLEEISNPPKYETGGGHYMDEDEHLCAWEGRIYTPKQSSDPHAA